MTGTVFDIKEFAIHDGPGARLTVFMKGCPLRCRWCHNPEGLSPKPQLMYKKNLCSHCGRCLEGCAHEQCRAFGRCIHACPNGCLSVAGTVYSCEQLAERIMKAAPMLNAMEGGVTISGGEPLMQADFVCELMDRVDGLHKALQTSGYAEPDTYRRVVSHFDFIMQDIKLVDPQQHLRYTGRDNRLILENISYLKSSGKQFVFRIPLIPGITDTPQNLTAAAKIAGSHRAELLPYNTLAGAKYDMLDMNYPLGELKAQNGDFAKYFENAVVR